MATLRRILASTSAWLLGATASVGVGLLALHSIGAGLTSHAAVPLRPEVIEQVSGLPHADPAHDDVPSPRPSLSADPTASTAPVVITAATSNPPWILTSVGGNVVARCGAAGVYLVSWSPAPGFRADGVRRGPSDQAWVRFESRNLAVQLTATCSGAVPDFRVRQWDPRHHDDDHPVPDA